MDDVTFAVLLFPSGKIRFYYEDDDIFVDNLWGSGISDGDNVNYKYPESFFKSNYLINDYTEFTQEIFPEEMSISEDGLFTGIPQNVYEYIEVEFLVTDYYNIPVRKTFLFNCLTSGVENENYNSGTILKVYPNPFLDILNIEFDIETECNTSLKIFNLMGENLFTLIDENMPEGHHQVSWNAIDHAGNKLPNGIYFCVIKTGNQIHTSKSVLSY